MPLILGSFMVHTVISVYLFQIMVYKHQISIIECGYEYDIKIDKNSCDNEELHSIFGCSKETKLCGSHNIGPLDNER